MHTALHVPSSFTRAHTYAPQIMRPPTNQSIRRHLFDCSLTSAYLRPWPPRPPWSPRPCLATGSAPIPDTYTLRRISEPYRPRNTRPIEISVNARFSRLSSIPTQILPNLPQPIPINLFCFTNFLIFYLSFVQVPS